MADLGEEGGISRSPSASTSQRRYRGRAAAGGGGPVGSRSDGWKWREVGGRGGVGLRCLRGQPSRCSRLELIESEQVNWARTLRTLSAYHNRKLTAHAF
jgi:hypothetical protein